MKINFMVMLVGGVLMLPCHANGGCSIEYVESQTVADAGCWNAPAMLVQVMNEEGNVIAEMYACSINSPCNAGYTRVPHQDFVAKCGVDTLTTCAKITADWEEDTTRHFLTRKYNLVQGSTEVEQVECACSQGYYGIPKYSTGLKRCSSSCTACPWHGFSGDMPTTEDPREAGVNKTIDDCYMKEGVYVDISGTFEMPDPCPYISD